MATVTRLGATGPLARLGTAVSGGASGGGDVDPGLFVGGFLAWHLPQNDGGEPAVGSSFRLDGANESVAQIFQAPKAGNLHKVHFRVSDVDSAPTDVHDIRIETVSTTDGSNTGTLVASNTNVTTALTTTGWKTVTLTADAAVTRAGIYAVVVKAPATNFGNITIGGFADDECGYFPYVYHVGAKTDTAMNLALEYDDGSMEPIEGISPWNAFSERVFGSGSSPNYWALRFKLRYPALLVGCRLTLRPSGDYQIVFFDHDGVTSTTLYTGDKDYGAADTTSSDIVGLLFSTTKLLHANTWYRLAVIPTTATTIGVHEGQVNAANLLDAVPGGQSAHLSTATGAPTLETDWTQTLTSRPWIVPLLGHVDSQAFS